MPSTVWISKATPIPPTDEIFELTLGRHTKRFKLVEIGNCWNFNEVLRRLATYVGTQIPEGQWLEAYNTRYGYVDPWDRWRPVAIADPSWESPTGGKGFPCVGCKNNRIYICSVSGFHGDCRWLMACCK